MNCNKFWLENCSNLFSDFRLIPNQNMSLSERMNTITRLVLIIFIFLSLLNFKYSFLLLSLSLLFIIILYYIQKDNMQQIKEGFNNFSHKSFSETPKIPHISQQKLPKVVDDYAYFYCNDPISLEPFDKTTLSLNQKLVGPANPKTKIAPIIIPPSHALDYWRANNLITHSQVNLKTEQDVYQSGYEVTTSCKPKIKENFYKNDNKVEYKTPRYGSNSWHPQQEEYSSTNKTQQEIYFPFKNQDKVKLRKNTVLEENRGQVNTSCSYNPKQIFTSNLPSNYSASNCQEDPRMAQYNKNLFTQIIEPGIYTVNQVNEPINSNMGISFTQQLEPTTYEQNKNGITFIQHDPRIIEPLEEPEPIQQINESNVYDPRFNGYGTSYRSYVDKQLGQPRFAYDDINAIRMPNYITRNKIDFTSFGDSYGPMSQEDGNDLTANIRELAQDAWFKNSGEFRENLMFSTLRKRNSEMWQRRMYPMSTSNQRMMGGKI